MREPYKVNFIVHKDNAFVVKDSMMISFYPNRTFKELHDEVQSRAVKIGILTKHDRFVLRLGCEDGPLVWENDFLADIVGVPVRYEIFATTRYTITIVNAQQSGEPNDISLLVPFQSDALVSTFLEEIRTRAVEEHLINKGNLKLRLGSAGGPFISPRDKLSSVVVTPATEVIFAVFQDTLHGQSEEGVSSERDTEVIDLTSEPDSEPSRPRKRLRRGHPQQTRTPSKHLDDAIEAETAVSYHKKQKVSSQSSRTATPRRRPISELPQRKDEIRDLIDNVFKTQHDFRAVYRDILNDHPGFPELTYGDLDQMEVILGRLGQMPPEVLDANRVTVIETAYHGITYAPFEELTGIHGQ
ncbi:hypothetical protein NA57DRAFT_81141 [Rhizodiscina lignyota]|uniref:Uncharacterized protein n=1 Tax=Rhizodiscina lignyota TaxID=1504668 RepID=A0A9P4M0I0_9PEZI|nr:hypothetical protein NA57DRAFT_81141 [Rhizodiscina lignyota]